MTNERDAPAAPPTRERHIADAADQVRATALVAEKMLREIQEGIIWKILTKRPR